MSEELRQIHGQLRTAQDKYAYFLLAAAGAAIGFAINKTQNSSLAWSQMPLAAAVLSWGLSFYFGCRYLEFVSSILYSNLELLLAESGAHPKLGKHPDMIAAASEGIREGIEKTSNRAKGFGENQFRLLIAGVIFFVIWHVLEMWLRTK